MIEKVEGMKKEKKKKEFYMDVKEELGVNLEGRKRIKIKILVKKNEKMSNFKNFEEGYIIKIIWLEVGIDEMKEEIKELI